MKLSFEIAVAREIIKLYILGECPAGHYCPVGTTNPDEHPCPASTFSASTRLEREDECADCTAGFYCEYVVLGQFIV